MGFAASSAMKIMLVARKSDLEFQAEMIMQAKMKLGNMAAQLIQVQANYDPGSPAEQQLTARITAIHSQEKLLDMNYERIKSQQQAVAAEIEGLEKLITDNIKSSFKLFS